MGGGEFIEVDFAALPGGDGRAVGEQAVDQKGLQKSHLRHADAERVEGIDVQRAQFDVFHPTPLEGVSGFFGGAVE